MKKKPVGSRAECGVLLAALEKPEYGEMALNLAQSIRLGSPRLPIALAVSGAAVSSLDEEILAIFDEIVVCDPAYYTLDGQFQPLYCKTHLDLLTPFRRTIFLDADSMLFEGADLHAEFEKYGNAELAPRCFRQIAAPDGDAPRRWFRRTDYSELLRRFRIDRPTLEICSQFLFFRSTEATHCFFSAARRLDVELRRLKRTVSDELAFSLASGMVPLNLHSVPYAPIAGPGALPVRGMLEKHYLGFTIHPYRDTDLNPWIDLYNSCVRKNAERFGLQSPFLWRK